MSYMECDFCVKPVASLLNSFDSHTIGASNPLHLYTYAEKSREFLPFLPVAGVHMQTHMHSQYIHTFLRSIHVALISCILLSCSLTAYYMEIA